jgi:hypothetical protein
VAGLQRAPRLENTELQPRPLRCWHRLGIPVARESSPQVLSLINYYSPAPPHQKIFRRHYVLKIDIWDQEDNSKYNYRNLRKQACCMRIDDVDIAKLVFAIIWSLLEIIGKTIPRLLELLAFVLLYLLSGVSGTFAPRSPSPQRR